VPKNTYEKQIKQWTSRISLHGHGSGAANKFQRKRGNQTKSVHADGVTDCSGDSEARIPLHIEQSVSSVQSVPKHTYEKEPHTEKQIKQWRSTTSRIS